jgi:hypothetical protein
METRGKKRAVKIIRKKEPLSEKATIDKAAADSFWHHKTIDELIKEQGVKPIETEEDFARISGGFEDWDDIDDFLEQVHRPLK